MKRTHVKRRSMKRRKARKNPSQYGIAPVVIAGILGLVSSIGGGWLSGQQQKKQVEAEQQMAMLQAQEAAQKRQLWLVLGGFGVLATLGSVAIWALTRDDEDDDKKKKKA